MGKVRTELGRRRRRRCRRWTCSTGRGAWTSTSSWGSSVGGESFVSIYGPSPPSRAGSSTKVIHRVIRQRPSSILILISCIKIIMFILIILTSSNEDIIEMVVNGDYHEFEPEKLRGLMKILPEMDEVKLDLNDHDDDYVLLHRWIYIARNVHEHDMWDSLWQSRHGGDVGVPKKCQKCVSAKNSKNLTKTKTFFTLFLPQGFATHDMFW